MKQGLAGLGAFVCLVSSTCVLARAEEATTSSVLTPLSDDAILDKPNSTFRLQSVSTRITAFDQYGYGFQSQAGPLLGAGSERTTIFEPQGEVVATQGDRLTHRIIVPIDIVTAASADALDSRRNTKVDALSSASRYNEAGTLDWTATYRTTATTDVSLRSAVHLEEPVRSWDGAFSTTQSLADGDTVLSESLIAVYDWFDHFDILGFRHGRTSRSSSTVSAGVTQILTPTTLFDVNYGVTIQKGELGNTWNSVPLANGKRGPEILPAERLRHAAVARIAQFLPWNGALHLYYRFYVDDWGIVAHSVEGELMQRFSPSFYVSALYRFHHQTGVDFYTELAPLSDPRRTADSDLAELFSHTIGGKIVLDVPMEGEIRSLHFDLGFERYFRTNSLEMNVITCGTGYRF